MKFICQTEGADCRAERRRATNLKRPLPVRLVFLRKVYYHNYKKNNRTKTALGSFCLAMNSGECVGLLGPNGAGKSTVMNILTGLIKPTSGYAVIYGHNIITDMDKIQQVVGFCPQFDVLWNELTVEDHLLFYMRLKGIPAHKEKDVLVNSAMQPVNMQQGIIQRTRLTFAKEKINTLSGGQRRLVSIAIAFIGDPRLVLLDEPTTGLDLPSRYNIWNLINEMKVGRTILITTHNMQEADALCSRIGVISNGKLICIDRPKYLKTRFGKGFRLSVTPTMTHTEAVHKLLTEKYPHMQLETIFARSHRYLLPFQNDKEPTPESPPSHRVKISDIVRDMAQMKKEGLVEEWVLSQCTMEEVFLNVIHEGDEE